MGVRSTKQSVGIKIGGFCLRILAFRQICRSYACSWIYLITSPTVAIFSNSSEGMDTPYSSSNAITSSNRSRESTSRSSLKRVASVISTFSWFNCSLMMAATFLTCFCSPYAFHYCVSDTLLYYFVVSGVFAFHFKLFWLSKYLSAIYYADVVLSTSFLLLPLTNLLSSRKQ